MRMKTKAMAALTTAIGLAALLGSATASAGLVESCDVGDLPGADACYGIQSGNIETPEANPYFYGDLLPSSAFGGEFGDYTTWTLLAYDNKEDVNDSNFLNGGTWSVDLSSGISELVIVLKQGNGWGAWYFDPAQSSGTWSTSWQGNGKGYSHGFALGRGGSVSVPEPATLGLLGLGLIGIGFARRRRA